MNTDPKDILNGARTAQRRIDRRRAELLRLREMESFLRATDYAAPVVKHSAGRGSVESTAMKFAALEERIQRDVEDLAERKLEAIALIGLLEDQRMQEVLWEYYIHAARNWDEAAEACGYTVRHCTRLHGRALQELRKMSLNVHIDQE